MTPERLNEIKDLEYSVMPGKWLPTRFDEAGPWVIDWLVEDGNPQQVAYVSSRKEIELACESRNALPELIAEIERLRLYERAMQSMADQFIHPKYTAEELARQQLKPNSG